VTVQVQDNPQQSRFEAHSEDGALAGQAQYRMESGSAGEIVVFTHTIVDDAFEGQGVGSTLAKEALDEVRGRGLKIRPECSFIRSYIERHPDYSDLVV
jgi:predicted GNAT family acetyltransferase